MEFRLRLEMRLPIKNMGRCSQDYRTNGMQIASLCASVQKVGLATIVEPKYAQFMKILKGCRADGGMKGLEVRHRAVEE